MTDDEVKKQAQQFATLKSKYQVRSDYEDSSPSSPLYFILQKVDLGIDLIEFERHWLKAHHIQLHKRRGEQPQQRITDLIKLGTEFSNLKSKYDAKAALSLLGWRKNPLYFILFKLDSGHSLTDSERRWLTDNHFTETLAIAKNNYFVRLKAKYQAIQHQNSSLSSPLYPILKRLEATERLSDEQVNWLKSHALFETLAHFQQQESVREALFAKLKQKYQATQHSDSSVSSPLYQILRNLDADRPLKASEQAWLKEHDLIKTLELAQEIAQLQHFVVLKKKYKATQYEDSSPSSHLYLVLKQLDSGKRLTDSDRDFLSKHQLTKTLALAIDKSAASLKSKIKSGIWLNEAEIDWLKQNGREDIVSFAKEKHFAALKSKYGVSDYQDKSPSSRLYAILQQLESGHHLLTDSEMRWLTDNHLTEMGALAHAYKISHFVALKTKYQATQSQEFSPASPLYPILTRLEATERLSDEQVNWLKSNELFDTLAHFQQQESVRKALFAKLKQKYQATQHSASSVSSPLYQILRNLEASKPLTASERAWLKEHDLIETLELAQTLAQEIAQQQQFAVLKKKYKATQSEESSPLSHLYKVLKQIDSGKPLIQSDINFLSKRKLNETIRLAVDKYAATLKSKVNYGNPLLSQAEIEWLKQNGREDIITFAKEQHFAALKSKYGVSDYRDKSPSSRLYAILKKLDNGKRLEPIEVAWLTGKKLFYPESQIFTTYHQIEATFYEQAYKRTGNHWKLPTASSHWRSAKEPEHALTLTENINFDNIKENKLKSALLTTRGGAFRDILKLNQAEQCALQAIKYQPSSHHPYTLMGAICYERGEYDEGDRWFKKAIKRGASPRDQDAEIKRVLKKADKKKRREMVKYLLKTDPVRYKWAKKYLVDKQPESN
jgi:predicted glutamine amidotransferase